MSEEAVVSTEAPATESTSGEPDWSQLPDNLSGAQVREIMEKHKQGISPPIPKAKEPEENVAKEAAKEAMRRYKVKVDGEEVEVDEDELRRGYSHQRAASKALNEGKALRKQAEQFAAMLKDPEKLFELAERLGHDTRTLAEKKLAKALEDELLDPKEKELRTTKARLEEYERKDTETKERAKLEHQRSLEKKFAAEYEQQFLSALKESQLPPTKPMIAEMAKYIGRAANLGFKMSVSEAATLVKDDIKQAQARLFKDADAQTLLGLLGEDLANKIRQHDIAKLKSPEEFLRTPERSQDAPKKKKAPSEKKSMSAAEWARFIRS